MKSIKVDALSRVYGRSFALHRVSCEFPSNSITAVLGNNGAGKTTLLNILATVETPTKGKVTYGDVGWRTFSKRHRARIGWVSHEGLVYDELTGSENLAYFARMYGLDEPKAVAQRWMERVELSDAGAKPVSAYSRGMRQRLSIARALLATPDLILLDEPLTGLDKASRALMLDVLSAERDRGATIIFITHDLSIPDAFIDRILILRDGKVAFHGTGQLIESFVEHA